jgi:hypothetical protein
LRNSLRMAAPVASSPLARECPRPRGAAERGILAADSGCVIVAQL